LELLVTDHPVCGTKVGFAEILLDAAATPPHEEGNAHNPNGGPDSFTFNTTAVRLKTIKEDS
jgi:hypothetical protein